MSKVEFTLKIPLDKKLVKDFGNFELGLKINDGVFDINKDFVQSFVKWFVMLDTLLSVTKSVRKLVFQ